jgi:phytoene synthase
MLAVCAWCWRADNLLDDGPQDNLAWLDATYESLVGDLEDVYAGRGLDIAEARALYDAVRRYDISIEHLRCFLDGIGMDRRIRRYRTFDQLAEYCVAVLSPVNVLAAHMLGFSGEHTLEYARVMGVAMQLSNICRDVGADYDRGRIYLPAEEMERFGVTEEDIKGRAVTDGFVELMKIQIDRARRCYRVAERGIGNISTAKGRWAAMAVSRAYALKLEAVERAGYDVLTQQPRSSVWRKYSSVAGAWRDRKSAAPSTDLDPPPPLNKI